MTTAVKKDVGEVNHRSLDKKAKTNLFFGRVMSAGDSIKAYLKDCIRRSSGLFPQYMEQYEKTTDVVSEVFLDSANERILSKDLDKRVKLCRGIVEILFSMTKTHKFSEKNKTLWLYICQFLANFTWGVFSRNYKMKVIERFIEDSGSLEDYRLDEVKTKFEEGIKKNKIEGNIFIGTKYKTKKYVSMSIETGIQYCIFCKSDGNVTSHDEKDNEGKEVFRMKTISSMLIEERETFKKTLDVMLAGASFNIGRFMSRREWVRYVDNPDELNETLDRGYALEFSNCMYRREMIVKFCERAINALYMESQKCGSEQNNTWRLFFDKILARFMPFIYFKKKVIEHFVEKFDRKIVAEKLLKVLEGIDIDQERKMIEGRSPESAMDYFAYKNLKLEGDRLPWALLKGEDHQAAFIMQGIILAIANEDKDIKNVLSEGASRPDQFKKQVKLCREMVELLFRMTKAHEFSEKNKTLWLYIWQFLANFTWGSFSRNYKMKVIDRFTEDVRSGKNYLDELITFKIKNEKIEFGEPKPEAAKIENEEIESDKSEAAKIGNEEIEFGEPKPEAPKIEKEKIEVKANAILNQKPSDGA